MTKLLHESPLSPAKLPDAFGGGIATIQRLVTPHYTSLATEPEVYPLCQFA